MEVKELQSHGPSSLHPWEGQGAPMELGCMWWARGPTGCQTLRVRQGWVSPGDAGGRAPPTS